MISRHVEFVCELTIHFQRWCSASKVYSFDKLSNLIVLEQFKNSIPERVATYVTEQKPINVVKAAELADDFVLTHKVGWVTRSGGGSQRSEWRQCTLAWKP